MEAAEAADQTAAVAAVAAEAVDQARHHYELIRIGKSGQLLTRTINAGTDVLVASTWIYVR